MWKKCLMALAFVMLFASSELSAQHYKNALGLRLGTTYGLTFVQALNRFWTVEGIVHRNYAEQTFITGLARHHQSLLFFTRNVNMYYGGGLHVGFPGESGTLWGPDAILGVEMTLFHINFSVDYQPQFHIGQEEWFQQQVAVSARYVIVEANWRNRWDRKRKQRQRKRKNYKGR